ncbi:helix-turn-helix transcriptional regulator [Clostridium ganghwense]|uniref:Replication protein n=1 Tax=Clostridium ganghwense TaxID=312089 RepID=A0ABT4CXZ6_9CLOT|nr:hypothetical protein [Clostridium ganghwense]MCY6372764.1 hypothetical protein [Clostridium ganghwense]
MLAVKSELQIKQFDDREIKDIIEALKFMLDDCNKDGYIRILNNQNNYGNEVNTYKNYRVKDLLNVIKLKKILNSGAIEPIDLYYSVNTYQTRKEATEDNIKQLVNVLIDIDYKKSLYKHLSPSKFVEMLEYEVFAQTIPTPSATVFTGNNVHVIYKLKYSVNATHKAKTLAKRVQKHITSQLKEFKADRSVNLTTLTRFIHTQNSKNMGEVSIKTYKNISYELRELQEWLPSLPSWYEDWKNKKKNKDSNKKARVTRLHNEYTLLKARVEDLEKLQELRSYKCYGHREVMCYLYRNFVIQVEANAEIAEERMLDFNSKFERPLKSNRIESKTRVVEQRTYKYKNDTLIALLDITEEEERELKVTISKAEKGRRNNERTKEANKAKRRNSNGLTKREKEKQEKMKQIKELIEKEYKNAEIAEIMGISIRQVQRLKKEL